MYHLGAVLLTNTKEHRPAPGQWSAQKSRPAGMAERRTPAYWSQRPDSNWSPIPGCASRVTFPLRATTFMYVDSPAIVSSRAPSHKRAPVSASALIDNPAILFVDLTSLRHGEYYGSRLSKASRAATGSVPYCDRYCRRYSLRSVCVFRLMGGLKLLRSPRLRLMQERPGCPRRPQRTYVPGHEIHHKPHAHFVTAESLRRCKRQAN